MDKNEQEEYIDTLLTLYDALDNAAKLSKAIECENERTKKGNRLKQEWNRRIDNEIRNIETLLMFSKAAGVNTINFSIAGTIAYGLKGTVNAGVTIDVEGNVAIQWSGAVGGGFPQAGITANVAVTNAPTYKELEDWGMDLGGSLSLSGVGGGFELLIIPNDDGIYMGRNFSVGGIVVPTVVELHAELSYTGTLYSFNIFGMLEALKFDTD